jgi:hypothetical protein
LEKAVEFGFDAYQKITKHQALAFVRTHADFDLFVQNGYKVISALPQPQADLINREETPASAEEHEVEETLDLKQADPIPISTDNLLDQLLALGELKEKGLLTTEEFNAQKAKLLRD